MKKILLTACVLCLVSVAKALPDASILISSPDKQIQFRLSLQNDQILYTVLFKNIPVVESSSIAMLLNDKAVYGEVKLKAVQWYQLNEQYPWLGVHATAVNNYKGAKVPLQH